MNSCDWIRKNYDKGLDWLYKNYQACVLEVDTPISPESYSRAIRKVRAQQEQMSDPMTSDDVATVNDALAFHDIDLTSMQIDKVAVNTWGSANNPNKQVKVVLTPSKYMPDQTKLLEIIRNMVKDYVPTPTPVVRRNMDNPKLYEINIADFHLGLLAWHKETGEDYDIKIARELYIECVEHLIRQAPKETDRVLLVIGNDLFNSDTIDNTTTKGTKQSEDTRFQLTFTTGWQMVVEAIQICRSLADVDVVVVPANHDLQRSYFMGEVLYAWYRDDRHVTINNEPKYYKYYSYGNNLIGFTHGDGAKMEQLPLLMATDVPDLWAKCAYREFHTGHYHTSITKMYGSEVERVGCRVVSIPSLAAQSDWIAKMGFRSLREAQAFIYDKEYGRIGTISYRPIMSE